MLATFSAIVVLLLAPLALTAQVSPNAWAIPTLPQQAIPAPVVQWNQPSSNRPSANQRTPAPSSRPSRTRRVLIGALVGFGAGFPVGVATAGYVGDTNNPSTGMRIENGARFGGLGAGIGALIGALSGKR
jgi:hypothetical protein